MSLAVRPARTPAEFDAFLRLPARLGGHAAGWGIVPFAETRRIFDAARNPALREWSLTPLLAWRGDAPVGRLAVAVRSGPAEAAHFGFLATGAGEAGGLAALLEAAAAAGRAAGAAALRGPLNFTLNHTAGALIDGFDAPFGLETPRNPPWLGAMLEGAGLRPARDLLAARLDPAAIAPAAPWPGLSVSRVGLLGWSRGMAEVARFYNAAWAGTPWFTPVGAAEAAFMARLIRPLALAGAAYLARIEGVLAGVAVVLPDLNEVTDPWDGALPVRGWPRLLGGLAGRVASARVPIFGLDARFRGTPQGRAVRAALWAGIAARARRFGWRSVEVSWVREDNAAMRQVLARLGAVEHRRWRLWEQPLG